MKLLLVGTIATAVFAGVPKFSGKTFENFFDSAVSRKLSESSGESSGEGGESSGEGTDGEGGGTKQSFDEMVFGGCYNAELHLAGQNDTLAMAMEMTVRQKACSGLANECKGLYKLCAKSGSEFCLTDAASYTKADGMFDNIDGFNPDLCSPCGQTFLRGMTRISELSAKFIGAAAFDAVSVSDRTDATSMSTMLASLGPYAAGCQKTNDNKFCGAEKLNMLMPRGGEGEGGGGGPPPPACIAECATLCIKPEVSPCECIGKCDATTCKADETAVIDSMCGEEAMAAAAALKLFDSTAQLCVDCGNLENACSDKCKGILGGLQKHFGACSIGFLQTMLVGEEMVHAITQMFAESKVPFATCLKSPALVTNFMSEKCGLHGSAPIIPAAKTVLKVETSMSVVTPLTTAEQFVVKDTYCDLVKDTTAQATGFLPSQILVNCKITQSTGRRLLATSYALEARVMEPAAADDAETSFVQMPSNFAIDSTALASVTTALAANVAEELSIPAPVVMPVVAAEPTADELTAEVLSEQTRVAVAKTQVGIVISEAELAALPADVRAAVETAVADPANAVDPTYTAPAPTTATAAPTTAAAAPTTAAAVPTTAAAAPTTAEFSAAPGHDAWSVAAAVVVAAAAASY